MRKDGNNPFASERHRVQTSSPVAADAMTPIESLPAKWRRLANDALRRSGTWNGNDIADRIEFMADELEAALASRRVAVDDAMVERACVGMAAAIPDSEEWPKDYPEDEQVIIRDGIRAALTAALQPDSGEG